MNKKYLIISLTIIALITALCIFRWKAWFGKITEEPYAVEQVIDRVTMGMGTEGINSRTITWRCGDSLTTAEVHIRPENLKEIQTFPAKGTPVKTQSGTNVYYRADFTLPQGSYQYQLTNGETVSPWYSFDIQEDHGKCNFLVSGDIQDIEHHITDTVFRMMLHRHPNADFVALLGDVIRRPTNDYWNLWFHEIDSLCATKPFVATCGNHEFYKGKGHELDPRWNHTFTHPDNGPEGNWSNSYYLDFPNMRLIVIDTQRMRGFKTSRNTKKWLQKVIDENPCRFCIVMMHHPIQAQSLGRVSFWERLYLKKTLNKVDLVLQGHDHSYARWFTKKHKTDTTPLYILTTNSDKHYLSRCRRSLDRMACGERVYQHVEVTENQIHISSYLVSDLSLYDEMWITRGEDEETIVLSNNELEEERLLMPKNYEGKTTLKTIRYKRSCELREQALKYKQCN